MEPLKELFNFEEQGFTNIKIKHEGDTITLRSNIYSREEFEKWKSIYTIRTHTHFNSKRLCCVGAVGERKVFRQVLICHHGVKHKGVKKKYTG